MTNINDNEKLKNIFSSFLHQVFNYLGAALFYTKSRKQGISSIFIFYLTKTSVIISV